MLDVSDSKITAGKQDNSYEISCKDETRYYSPVMVSPRLDATELKVVWVVEPLGTYTVREVPVFLVTKFAALPEDTVVEPI